MVLFPQGARGRLIFGHVTLVDEPGEPLRIRCWMPGESCRDYPIDVPSFLLLAELVMKVLIKRMK